MLWALMDFNVKKKGQNNLSKLFKTKERLKCPLFHTTCINTNGW